MKPSDNFLSRREFARRAALGAASTSLLPLRELVPPTAASESPHPAQSPAQTPANAPKLSPQSQAEAEARHEAILAQYPDRFSDAQKSDLKRLCVALQPSLDRLRAYAIDNADQPALYLKPLVEREKKPVTRPAASPGASTAAPAATKSSVPAKP
jgi:hypothetical protein